MNFLRLVLVFSSLVIFGLRASYADQSNYIEQAIQSPGRLNYDLARDPHRKPLDVMTFSGIAPGMHVLDLFAGGGYYTDIMSNIVGPEGLVIAHNNEAYLPYVGQELRSRFSQGRLANVKQILVEAADLELESKSLDLIIFVLGYHDIYLVQRGWPKIDLEHLLATLHRGLKDSGKLLIIDHAAEQGSGHETGTTLHRIAPEIVKSEIETAGFKLAGTSDALRNPDDPLTISVFDPTIRGKTDRFVFLFEKE